MYFDYYFFHWSCVFLKQAETVILIGALPFSSFYLFPGLSPLSCPGTAQNFAEFPRASLWPGGHQEREAVGGRPQDNGALFPVRG